MIDANTAMNYVEEFNEQELKQFKEDNKEALEKIERDVILEAKDGHTSVVFNCEKGSKYNHIRMFGSYQIHIRILRMYLHSKGYKTDLHIQGDYVDSLTILWNGGAEYEV